MSFFALQYNSSYYNREHYFRLNLYKRGNDLKDINQTIMLYIYFIILGGIAGFLGSIIGGPVAFVRGCILGMFLGAVVPIVAKLKTKNKTTWRLPVLIGALAGFLAGIVMVISPYLFADMIDNSALPSYPWSLVVTCTLYGGLIFLVIGLRDRYKLTFEESFLLIYFGMSFCHFSRFPLSLITSIDRYLLILISGFGFTVCFALFWCLLVVKQMPFYQKYTHPKKSARAQLQYLYPVLAIGITFIGLYASFAVSLSIHSMIPVKITASPP